MRSLRVPGGLCLLACLLGHAGQSLNRLEIRGTVLETGTLQPVSGAEVLYWSTPRAGTPMMFSADRALGKTVTDAAGSFVFRPAETGSYYVLVKKQGYTGGSSRSTSINASASVTSERPTAEVRLLVARSGRLTGGVADGASGRPLANARASSTRICTPAASEWLCPRRLR